MFHNVILELKRTSSSNEKLEILKQYVEKDEALATLLLMCFDYERIWGVNDKTVKAVIKQTKFQESGDIASFSANYNAFIDLTLSKRISKAALSNFAKQCMLVEFEFYCLILCKNLKCGVGLSTIKKVLPMIKIFNSQAANSLTISEIESKFVPSTYIVEPKLDGVRCLAFVENGGVTLWSRAGKQITNFLAIETDLVKLYGNSAAVVLDGELVCDKNKFNLLMSTLYANESKAEVVAATKYSVFDAIPLSDFRENASSVKLIDRKRVIANKAYGKIETVPYYLVKSPEEFEAFYNEFVKDGYEGIMVKNIFSSYRFKRTNDWIKCKPRQDFTLVVKSVKEGTGRHTGKLGSIDGVYIEDSSVTTNVGSGFDDSQREELWAKRNELIGKTFDIYSDCFTVAQDGTKSFRFPIFKCWRQDL